MIPVCGASAPRRRDSYMPSPPCVAAWCLRVSHQNSRVWSSPRVSPADSAARWTRAHHDDARADLPPGNRVVLLVDEACLAQYANEGTASHPSLLNNSKFVMSTRSGHFGYDLVVGPTAAGEVRVDYGGLYVTPIVVPTSTVAVPTSRHAAVQPRAAATSGTSHSTGDRQLIVRRWSGGGGGASAWAAPGKSKKNVPPAGSTAKSTRRSVGQRVRMNRKKMRKTI